MHQQLGISQFVTYDLAPSAIPFGGIDMSTGESKNEALIFVPEMGRAEWGVPSEIRWWP